MERSAAKANAPDTPSDAAWAGAERAEADGDWPTTAVRFENLAAVLEEDPLRQCQAWLRASRAYRFLGEIVQSADLARRALERARGLPDRRLVTEALLALGYLHWRRGDIAVAEDLFVEAMQGATALGDEALQGQAQCAMADLLSGGIDYERAVDLYAQGARRLAAAELWGEWVRARNNHAQTLVALERPAEAIPLLQEALERTKHQLEGLPRTWVLVTMADVYARLGDVPRVHALLEEARARPSLNDAPMLQVLLQGTEAMVRAQQGDSADGIAQLLALVPPMGEIGAASDQALLLLDAAMLQRRSGDHAGASRSLAQARSLLQGTPLRQLLRRVESLEGGAPDGSSPDSEI